MIVFGPIVSRRLGKSLGINNVPLKTCSYACIYCQLGATSHFLVNRRAFFKPKKLIDAVIRRLQELREHGEIIDYLTLVPNGEPTLDINLGKIISELKHTGIKVAVISNASLLSDYQVREDLKLADWVSLKVDTVDTATWKKLNQPYKSLKHSAILAGILMFSEEFRGTLTTETMLVAGINDSESLLKPLTEFLNMVDPNVAYLQVPSRPPVCKGVKLPSTDILLNAFHLFIEAVDKVKLLINEEEHYYGQIQDLEKELLGISIARPLSKEVLESMLKNANEEWSFVENLKHEGKLEEIHYQDHSFFIHPKNHV